MRAPLAAWLFALLLVAGCSEPLRHTTDAAPRPASPPSEVAASARATDHFPTSSGELAVIPLEHATLLFVWQGLAIYVDPTSPSVDDPSLPKADAVLVTDVHYDHLDPFALTQVAKEGTVVLGSAGAGARWPMSDVVRPGETRTLLPGIRVTGVPALNLVRGPAEGLRYHQDGQAVGYVVELGGKRLYVSSDTECTPETRALADIDIAFVSLNVPYAMTAAEATSCVAAFRPKVVFPYAYRHAVPSRLDRAALGSGIDVRRRELYPRAEEARQKAYDALAHGMWGSADDALDRAQQLDPQSDSDYRVRWTRGWLREYERPWPW